MTAVELYRDDGPLAAWIARRLAAPAQERNGHRLAWLAPPLIRLLEYGALVALAAVTDRDALPICFALVGVLAFHHYDTVYRLRHQRLAAPPWVRLAGGGWDGRLLVAGALALAGGLRVGLLVAAVGLALVYVTESTVSWHRFGRTEGAAGQEDEGEDEDGE